MVAETSKHERVADLMDQQEMGLDRLVGCTGIEKRVIEAIAYQRYTPSPTQREQVSGALGVERERVVWGHAALVDESIHQPV